MANSAVAGSIARGYRQDTCPLAEAIRKSARMRNPQLASLPTPAVKVIV